MARTLLMLEEFLPYRLSLASNAVSQVIAQAYEDRFDLKMVEWRVLSVLAEAGESTQQTLVGLTKMDKVSVSRAAQALEKKKLLRRRTSDKDARSLHLSLTPKGWSLYERVVPAARALEQEVLEGLGAKEIAELKAVLRKLEAAAERVLSGR